MSTKIFAKYLVTAAVCLSLFILVLLGGCSGGEPHLKRSLRKSR